jgi:hypothetical protein
LKESAAFLLILAAPASAQTGLLTGYYQNVPLISEETELFPGGFRDFNRFRVAISPSFGSVSFEAAYEQVLTLRENEGNAAAFVGAVPAGGEWLELQWTIEESEHLLWQHRFDRLSLVFTPSPELQIDLGRQAVSWATTLFFTPADPFSPFDPADPFREFRAGVDAARVRVYPGALSELDFIVRPTKTAVGEELTALARGLTTWRNWEISGWGGSLYGDVSGAAAASGALGAWAVRGEAVVRDSGEEIVLRASLGIDRRFTVSSRDLLLVAEYQHDGFGAGEPEDYAALVESEPFLRGELQVLGREEIALQSSYQWHPLWSVSGLLLWNLTDGSLLVSPGFAFSAGDETTITGGLFLGAGADELDELTALPSEYGVVPATAYLSVSFFF